MISARTRIFAVLGDPVAHSLSPLMHNAAFRTLGIDAVYVALPVPVGEVGQTMRLLARQGGGGNVTIPHKAEAAAAVEPTPTVAALGAVNTFWGDGSRLLGVNTDVAGVIGAWESVGRPDGPWLVLGTGGSARGAVQAAIEIGACVAIRSREASRAASLGEWAVAQGATLANEADCRVVVNATPQGLRVTDGLPFIPGSLPHVTTAIDLVYARGETRWAQAMRDAGCRAIDGRTVLILQGAAAFRHWFPKQSPPLDVMIAAVHDALG